MRGGGGGGGGGDPPPPPLEFAKLNVADIFHICALPQLNVKVGPPLPWEKNSGSAPESGKPWSTFWILCFSAKPAQRPYSETGSLERKS